MQNIIVTTKHRGVFFGQVADDADLTNTTPRLENARCAIYWGTTGGVGELAKTGPTKKSRIGTPATIVALHDITAVFAVTDEASKKWLAAA